jgi:NAD(P)-dependent dehydrogenase (short-subunit alcohol dehydrogenase family)
MKTVVVTGASHGLGQYIADVFLKAGWHVVGTGRSARPDNLNAEVEYQQFDASNAEACTNFWQRLQTEGEICLVNNAGSYVSGGLLETQPEDYDKQMQSNYFSGVYMTRGLVEKIANARIFNIISNSALISHKATSAYGAAKAASMHFFQSLQKEFPAEKYQITNLYPSDIASQAPNPDAISPRDLATLIVELAESKTSYYLKDITVFPVKR